MNRIGCMILKTLTAALEKSDGRKLALVGIPDDSNSSFFRGAAEAPPTIRAQLFSDAFNMWTELGVDLGEHVFFDAGDLNLGEDPDAWTAIQSAVEVVLDHGLPPICLGGDHAITYPIVKGFRNKYDKLSILHFDAHPDLYDNFDNNPHSHASPFARIMENHLADRLVQVGVRTATGHQREQAKRFGVEMIEMRELSGDLRLEFDSPVYVSVDIDGLDPAYAPGVSHPEPGGLSPRQVIDTIQRLQGRLVGADIVEVNPRRDYHDLTAVVAAKILKEIAGKILLQA